MMQVKINAGGVRGGGSANGDYGVRPAFFTGRSIGICRILCRSNTESLGADFILRRMTNSASSVRKGVFQVLRGYHVHKRASENMAFSNFPKRQRRLQIVRLPARSHSGFLGL